MSGMFSIIACNGVAGSMASEINAVDGDQEKAEVAASIIEELLTILEDLVEGGHNVLKEAPIGTWGNIGTFVECMDVDSESLLFKYL